MCGVAHQMVAVEPSGEHLLADRDGLGGISTIESGSAPRLLIALYDESRESRLKAIAMRLEDAVFIFGEEERERVERPCCAEPDKTCGTNI